jgi:hypothetical protein
MPPTAVSIRLSMRIAFLVLVALLASLGAIGAEAATVVTQIQAGLETFPAVPGLFVTAGDQLTFIASGEICTNASPTCTAVSPGGLAETAPAGYKLPGAPKLGLVCGIQAQSASDLFFIGQHYSARAQRSGSLLCGVNGTISSWPYTGHWTLTVVVGGSSTTRLEGFVDTLYDHLLGRTPSADEASAWIQFLQATPNGENAAPLVVSFLNGPEYLSRTVSVPEFVAGLYSLLLGRPPEPSGLSGWVDYLKVQFSAMLPTFVSSPEFHALVPNTQDRPSVQAVVVRLYQQVLGRSPQAAEAAAWVDYIVATGDLLGVARGFFESREYNSPSLADHVTRVYRTFLGRDPTPGEVGPWVSFLANLRLPLVDLFVGSDEFRDRFRTMLAASGSGFAAIALDDANFAAIAVHESGETLGAFKETDTSGAARTGGGAWTGTTGQRLDVSVDPSGRPERAAYAGALVLFSRYTATTVDVTVFDAHQQGATIAGVLIPGVPITGGGQALQGSLTEAGATALRGAAIAVAAADCMVLGSLAVSTFLDGLGVTPGEACPSVTLKLWSGVTAANLVSSPDAISAAAPILCESTTLLGVTTPPTGTGCLPVILDLLGDAIEGDALTWSRPPTGSTPGGPTNTSPSPVAPAIVTDSGQGTSQVAHGDPNANEQHTYSISVHPRSPGAATVSASGLVTYTAPAGFSDRSVMEVHVVDHAGGSGRASVLVCLRTGRATLTLRDSLTSQPISGAPVFRSLGEPPLVSDPSGVVTFDCVPSGVQVAFSIEAPGFVPQDVAVVVAPGQTLTRDVFLARQTGAVSVTVRGPSGTLAGIPVIGPVGQVIASNGAGVALFPAVPVGLPTQFSVNTAGFLPAAISLQAVAGATVSGTLELSPVLNQGTIVVTVQTPQTVPVAGATVSYSGGAQTTGADGVATFTGVPAGSVVVFNAVSGEFGNGSATVVPVANQSRSITIVVNVPGPPGNIQFHVQNVFGGAPVPGAAIVYSQGFQGTDASGNATFTGVASGSAITFSIQAPGFVSTTATVTPQPGGTTPVTVQLTEIFPDIRGVYHITSGTQSSSNCEDPSNNGSIDLANRNIVFDIQTQSGPSWSASMSFSSQGVTGSGSVNGTVTTSGAITGSGQVTTTTNQGTGVGSLTIVSGSVTGNHISMNTEGTQVSPPGSCIARGHMEGDR